MESTTAGTLVTETFSERTVLEHEFEVPSVHENTKNECRSQFPCSVSSQN